MSNRQDKPGKDQKLARELSDSEKPTRWPLLDKIARYPRLEASDWIALAALFLSLYAVGTKLWEDRIGPELTLVSPANRVVELRCTTSVDVCLGTADGSDAPNGRMSVILPFYFINTGALGQNEVISRLWVEVDAEGKDMPEDVSGFFPATLYVTSDWKQTESGRGPSTPFAPILIEGRNAAGAEFRAIDFERVHRLPWHIIATAIAKGHITGLTIKLHARTELESGVITETCVVEFGDRQREILEGRFARRSAQYISTTCKG